ncbi:MAG: hypothetical protein SWY16_09265 [Cyanobacteriota bacterium]|nr:hypothetical protein [Cyanobacteriota bacterium]
MSTHVELLPGAISEIFASASESGYLTLCDRYGLMVAAMDENLDEDERRAIDRLLRAIDRGRVKIVTH